MTTTKEAQMTTIQIPIATRDFLYKIKNSTDSYAEIVLKFIRQARLQQAFIESKKLGAQFDKFSAEHKDKDTGTLKGLELVSP